MRARVGEQCDPSRTARAVVAVLAVLALARPAGAAPPATSPDCRADGKSPPPAEAGCVARAEPESEDVALLIPRVALAIPRLVFRTATEVLTIGSELQEHYGLSDRMRVVETERRKFGVYPIVLYDTGHGFVFGARLVHDDLLGAGESGALHAVYGGRFRQLYEADVDTGQRWDEFRPGVQLAYETDDRGRFYGIGNGDRENPDRLDLPLDAQVPGPAVRAFYRLEQLRLRYSLDVELTPTWQARFSQLWRAREISSGPTGGPFVDQIFAPETLVGFGPMLVDAYTEVELLWDSREALRYDTPRELPGAGFRLQTWAGLQNEFAAPHGRFARIGIDLHSFIDLYRGNRILHLRVRGALAIGGLDDIPFLDLPELGGPLLLRGYDMGRFHGRLSLLGSVEYRYPVQETVAAYMFVDTGRVFSSLSDIHLHGMASPRVGFGGGLQLFTLSKALFRLQIASSIDGGLFVHFSLNTTDELSATY